MASRYKVGKVGTKVRRGNGGALVVAYHGTPVVTVSEGGKITLDHGGWMTATTKTRMNQASNQYNLGFTVYQKNRKWLVAIDGKEIPFDETPLVVRS